MALDIDIDLESILRTFAAECEERIAEMEEAMVALESHPENRELLNTIFRGAHTIKGNAASLGMATVAEFTHALESLLQRLRAGAIPVSRKAVTLLLQSVDALREMLPGAMAGEEQRKSDHATLLVRLVEGGVGIEQHPPIAEAGNIEEPAGGARNGTIRVEIHKLDRMLNLAGEIAIAQGRLHQVLGGKKAGKDAFEAREHLERLSLDLQEEIMKVRMVPVGSVFRQYARVVRDVALAAGREARLALEGEEAEIDLSVVEHLKDPLTHMVRNAIDHGIESPETRRARGKDPCGLLTLKAFRDGGTIVVQLIDDGAGLNCERIIARAKERGLVANGDKLSEQEIFQFIFEPGFSTATTVTELSGRGVGMEVVRRDIEAVRGSVGLLSEAGRGTTFTIRLPLTLAIIEGFSVGVGDDTYIFPLHAVRECWPFVGQEQAGANGRGMINLRGDPVPYVRLRHRFGIEASRPGRESVVVVASQGVKAGIVVDTLYGPRQTVIKPLDKQFFRSSSITGSAILDNGRVALILDIPSVLRDVIQSSSQVSLANALPLIEQER
jgi:two-component system chemotaxis sensor kinase CheA